MSERSNACHPQPHHGRTQAEQRLGYAELAPASDQFVVPDAGSASLTRRPGQWVAEDRVGGERVHNPPAPMTDGEHPARGLEATECHSRSFVGGEVRTGVAGVSPKRDGSNWLHVTFLEGRAQLETRRRATRWWPLPSEDHATGSLASATAVVLASVIDVEDRNAPPWRTDDEYAPEGGFDVTSSRCTLSGPGNDGEWFMHLKFITHSDIGREEFGQGMATFWRGIVDEPIAFPP